MSIIVGVIFILGVNPVTVDMPGWSHFATQDECTETVTPVLAKLKQLHPDKTVTALCIDVTPEPKK